MKKNVIFVLAILFLGLSYFSCNQKVKEEPPKTVEKKDSVVYKADTTAFGNRPIPPDSAIRVTNPITYAVVIKNPDKKDEWTAECLKKVDRQTIAKLIFDAVYAGKITALSYIDEQPISIDSVRQIEKKYARNRFGKIEFEEEWLLDPNNFRMNKKVKALTLGYELYCNGDSVRSYTAAFKIRFKD